MSGYQKIICLNEINCRSFYSDKIMSYLRSAFKIKRYTPICFNNLNDALEQCIELSIKYVLIVGYTEEWAENAIKNALQKGIYPILINYNSKQNFSTHSEIVFDFSYYAETVADKIIGEDIRCVVLLGFDCVDKIDLYAVLGIVSSCKKRNIEYRFVYANETPPDDITGETLLLCKNEILKIYVKNLSRSGLQIKSFKTEFENDDEVKANFKLFSQSVVETVGVLEKMKFGCSVNIMHPANRNIELNLKDIEVKNLQLLFTQDDKSNHKIHSLLKYDYTPYVEIIECLIDKLDFKRMTKRLYMSMRSVKNYVKDLCIESDCAGKKELVELLSGNFYMNTEEIT